MLRRVIHLKAPGADKPGAGRTVVARSDPQRTGKHDRQEVDVS